MLPFEFISLKEITVKLFQSFHTFLNFMVQ